MATSFLALPTELRFEVYRYLVTDCLEYASLTDFHAMLLSCQEIHRDLMSEFTAKLQPLFSAQHDWRKSNCCREPIRFILNHNYTSGSTLSKLHIEVPFIDKWHKSAKRRDYRSFGKLCTILQPALHLPWHTLTVRFVHNDTTTPLLVDLNFLSFKFFQCVGKLSKSNFVLENVRRLVLEFPNRKTDDSARLGSLQQLFACALLDMTSHLSESKKVKRGWACQVSDGMDIGYSLVLDFDTELVDPERVVSKFLQVGHDIEVIRKNSSGDEETTKAEISRDLLW